MPNRLLALVVAVLLALGGCATVPTSGPIEHHTQQVPGTDSGVSVHPLPPATGASQLLVVEGFLHAMSIHQPNYAVARQYLTETANALWHPESGVQVYADGKPPEEFGQTVMLITPLVGRLDSLGSFATASEQLRHDFELVRDANNQWRISNPPDGLLVSRYLFSTNFTPVTVHFMDASGSVLVPEQRYFANGDQALTAAVQAVLSGPSERLAPALRRASVSELDVDNVSLDERGVTMVELGSDGLRLTTEERQNLLAEIVNTVVGFAQVTAVQVSIGGLAIAGEFGGTELDGDDFTRMSPDNVTAQRSLFAIAEGRVVALREANWADFSPVEADLTRPELIAVRSDLAEVAAITDSATRLVLAPVGAAKSRTVRTGTGLLRPDFARNGELWSATASGPGSFRVFRDGLTIRVDGSELPKRPLVASKLSPDGTRIALVLRNGTRTEVGVAVVVRTDDQIRLTGWRPLEVNLSTGTDGAALDLGWASRSTSTKWSPAEVAVLQRLETGDTSVVRVSEDGATATDIGPTKAASLIKLAVVPGRPAVALTDSGAGYRFESEFNWALAVTAVDDLAYSG